MHDLIFISIAIYLKMLESHYFKKKMSINLNVHIFDALHFLNVSSFHFPLLDVARIIVVLHFGSASHFSYLLLLFLLAIFGYFQFVSIPQFFFGVCGYTRIPFAYSYFVGIFFFIRLFVFIYFYKLIVGGVLSLTLSVL